MKKFALAAIVAFALTLASCSNNGPLTASSAKSALKKEAFLGKDYVAKEFKTGIYEADESELQNLAKLQAAGMISFTVDKVIEYVSRRQYSGFFSYTHVTIENSHYFVGVSLTEAGKKFVVEKPEKQREDILEDMRINNNLDSVVPEYMYATYAVDGNVEVVEQEDMDFVDDSESVDTVASQPAEQQAPADRNAAYKAARNRENVKIVYVRMGRNELVKVKEVRCTEDMYKAGQGTARFLTKFVDKTPFGYVFDCPAEGYVSSHKATFTLYQDMGWVVADVD